jgi:hypothetical protein
LFIRQKDKSECARFHTEQSAKNGRILEGNANNKLQLYPTLLAS